MTIEQFANLFDIAGSVAVVVSLLFVGIQLARANRESRNATMQAAMFREIDNSLSLADHAATWDKIVTSQPLAEGAELRCGVSLYNAFMTDCEYRYRQYRSGYLDRATWEARKATLPGVMALPIHQVWRTTFSGRNHSPDFLAMLESLGDAPDDRAGGRGA